MFIHRKVQLCPCTVYLLYWEEGVNDYAQKDVQPNFPEAKIDTIFPPPAPGLSAQSGKKPPEKVQQSK
jgi:hypothetical protein